MNLLIVSATPFEIQPLIDHLASSAERVSDFHFKKKEVKIRILVTGVGIAHTAFSLGHVLAKNNFDLVINAGIAGAFNRSLKIGDVVQIGSEEFGDMGAEEKDGRLIDLFEMQLWEKDHPPFQNGKLLNKGSFNYHFLPTCQGLTVNKVHGSAPSIKATKEKYEADIESLEGGAFFLACILSEVPFLAIRSISNYVEPRNREGWDMPLAINNLNKVLVEIIEMICEQDF